jgi:hypothetical protein
MLTLKKSSDTKMIAKVRQTEGKDKPIYLLEDDSKDSQIKMNPTEMINHFNKYCKLDKKLNISDMKILESAYVQGIHVDQIPSKLQRKYVDAIEYVKMCRKKYLEFNEKYVFPIIQDESYRIYISGLSGSGKSTAVSMFLKHNPPKMKGAGIFLFSPVRDDKALSSIKNLIHIDLLDIEVELKGELQLEHIPPGSVLIFDDVESYDKKIRKLYMDFRDIALERGRHFSISCITVSHNARNGNTTKASIRESQYWILFPKHNSTDAKNILKLYGGLSTPEIQQVIDLKSRWVLYKKSVPKYAVGEHSVLAF